MFDNRGQYVAVGAETPYPQKNAIRRGIQALASMPLGRPRFRVSLVAIVLLIVLPVVYIFSSAEPVSMSSPETLSDINLSSLALPYEQPLISNGDSELTWMVGKHHNVTSDFPADYTWVNSQTRNPIPMLAGSIRPTNNAMGRMPKGSPYDMLVIGRGRAGTYLHGEDQSTYNSLTVIGFFANYNGTSEKWERVGPEPYVLDLPVWRQFPRPCEELLNGTGPSDPRFIWSDDGEPLAVIGTSSRTRNVCKSVGMVDLRAVWPGLKTHLEEIGYGDIPIQFDTFTEIGKHSNKTLIEENWAPFYPGPMPPPEQTKHQHSWWATLFTWGKKLPPASAWPYFATQVNHRTIVKVNPDRYTFFRSRNSYVMADDTDLSVPGKEKPVLAGSGCIFNSLPDTWDRLNFQYATPFHRMTLCPRGECIPSRNNTVLIGIVHYKVLEGSYRRVFVTMSVDAPHQILSVSRPLHFGSAASDKHIVFSLSMSFLPTKKSFTEEESPFLKSQDAPGGFLGHGWLDDTIVVGGGLKGAQYDAVHLSVGEALRSHTLCSPQKTSAVA